MTNSRTARHLGCDIATRRATITMDTGAAVDTCNRRCVSRQQRKYKRATIDENSVCQLGLLETPAHSRRTKIGVINFSTLSEESIGVRLDALIPQQNKNRELRSDRNLKEQTTLNGVHTFGVTDCPRESKKVCYIAISWRK